jgi:zinc transporter, ZIP family
VARARDAAWPARSWPARLIGLVIAFGAGALVSAVSFELFEEGIPAA